VPDRTNQILIDPVVLATALFGIVAAAFLVTVV
jgi:hypothetical protein